LRDWGCGLWQNGCRAYSWESVPGALFIGCWARFRVCRWPARALRSIMAAMIVRQLSDWWRIGAGFGLAWLLSTPHSAGNVVRACGAGERVPGVQPEETRTVGQTSQRRPAPTLPYIVPDTPAPRWPNWWQQAAQRQTAGWRDGVTVCGQRGPHAPDRVGTQVAETQSFFWHRFAIPATPLWPALLWDGAFAVRTAALRSSILRTGPPIV